ncbi:pseudouridine synthase [Rhodococcus sp. MEB064]|uniref:pseudouridine synthase n=1 Tax=Rhodococcus sp. MEB064 TaxID=1587522 RepID=UPI0005AC2CDA|nr:pseudouridine synthase [Rhodococcus sp. MEB064]KIQ17020.1 pseudouridine synthase [Rhodococcus sp. MEB064]
MTALPLPFRDGLAPLRIRLPHGDHPDTTVEYLGSEYPDDAWASAMTRGEVVDERGRPYTCDTRYRAGAFVYFYRVPAAEVPVPFELDVLYEDDAIVVVDKPHFLATIPRGRHVTETATVRLRRRYDDPEITPAHRLDRATAGVLLFTRASRYRRAYQDLFSTGSLTKEYEAVAGYDATLDFPRTVRSRIVKEHGVMTAHEEPGEANSETRVEIIERVGDAARYRLFPRTGKTHQLRLHLSSLGIPIHGDPYYPTFTSVAPDDFSTPLQLLARRLSFTDPLTGNPRTFRSRRKLRLI